MISVLVLGAIWGMERSALQYTLHFLNTIITEFAAEIHWAAEYTVRRDISVRTGTRYGLESWGIESLFWTTISAHVQTGQEFHSASSAMGTVSFSTIQRPELILDHSTPYSGEVKERVELNFYTCVGFVACSMVKITFLLPSGILLPHINPRTKILFAHIPFEVVPFCTDTAFPAVFL